MGHTVNIFYNHQFLHNEIYVTLQLTVIISKQSLTKIIFNSRCILELLMYLINIFINLLVVMAVVNPKII